MKRVIALGVVLVAAILAAPASPTAETKLTASISSRPGVSGVFLASLSGRTLSWRLLVHGLGSPVVAQVRASRAGPVVAVLCRSCSRSAHGQAALGAKAATALGTGTAYIDVHPAGASKPRVLARVGLGVPTLEIAGPSDGATLTLPVTVNYTITSFQVGSTPLGSLEVAAADGSARAMLQVTGQSGSTVIPDNKRWLLGGPRDITFSLVTGDGTRVPNPEARVTVHGVTIAGRR